MSRSIVMKIYPLSIGLLLAAFSPVAAQAPTSTPPAGDEVVKITTNLIQIDVTVTDKDGKVVPGLTVDDFELFENGQRQNLSGVTFVSRSVGGAAANVQNSASAVKSTDAVLAMPGRPTGPTSPVSARRTIAIVVDDLNLSFGSVYYARRALRRFVEQQMQPGDLVAIIRIGGAVGAFQQFTSNKQALLAAIDLIRWNPLTSEVDPLTPVGQTPQEVSERFVTESNHVAEQAGQDSSGRLSNMKPHESVTQTKARDLSDLKAANPLQAGIYAQASIGSMRYVVQGMSELPGRKMMMLFSDGIRIDPDSGKNRTSAVYAMLQDLVEYANRSSVVVYTFDTKGLKSASIQASDSTYEVIDGHRQQKEQLRADDFRKSQDGLAFLAQQTGGRALLNSNDLNGGIERFLEEQAGYYLLAYVPEAESFDPSKRRFNKIEVKVRPAGLRASYRGGFFSTAPDERMATLSGPQRDLVRALTSPFTANEIPVAANALYADDATDGGYVRSFLHIDAKSLKFTEAADGWKTATFDIAAVTFGSNGVPADRKESQYTIKAKGPTFDAMMQKGFVYVLIMPVKQPGVYHYRVALRDSNSGKVGSAAQIVEIPDLTEKKLAVSSLAVEGVSMDIWQKIAAGKVGSGPGQVQVPSTLLYDTVLRSFPPGSVLRYGFEVYNAKGDPESMPRLEVQARILQNNAAVVDGSVNKFDARGQTDPKHVRVSGAILLKDTLLPGDYVLQLVVRDPAGKQSATQVLPFEIVK